MLTKKEILNTLRLHKPHFEKLGVIRIGLFGSYANDSASEDSDVDIYVELQTPDYHTLVFIMETLERDLNKKIDVIRKGPHLREKFLQTIEKEMVYA